MVAADDPTVTVRELGRPGDLGWIVQAHGEIYADQFGWDSSFETLVARIVADFASEHVPGRDAAWIAEVDGKRAGCVLCVAADAHTAKLRVLLVDPAARGLGLGSRMVAECLRFAKKAGYRRVRLWTTDKQVAARRIYEAAGFELVEEHPDRAFDDDVVGQTWSLPL